MSRYPITKLWYAALGLLLSLSTADAHVGDRLYPIAYLSKEMLEEIRLDDGLVDEWSELVGEPTMTALEFSAELGKRTLEPSDLDFRIWLAWHDDPVRIYLAFVASDDDYVNTHDYSVDWHKSIRDYMNFHDSIILGIDGDHSGGGGTTSTSSSDEWREVAGQTQEYKAIARTVSGPTLDDAQTRYATETFSWRVLPPYGDAGGGVFGEAPVISVIELYVTPFDDWEGYDSPGEIEVSELTAGRGMGFSIGVYDFDSEDDWGRSWTPDAMLPPAHAFPIFDIEFQRADSFLDGILLGPDPSAPLDDSAVEAVSWGRIKASLQID